MSLPDYSREDLHSKLYLVYYSVYRTTEGSLYLTPSAHLLLNPKSQAPTGPRDAAGCSAGYMQVLRQCFMQLPSLVMRETEPSTSREGTADQADQARKLRSTIREVHTVRPIGAPAHVNSRAETTHALALSEPESFRIPHPYLSLPDYSVLTRRLTPACWFFALREHVCARARWQHDVSRLCCA